MIVVFRGIPGTPIAICLNHTLPLAPTDFDFFHSASIKLFGVAGKSLSFDANRKLFRASARFARFVTFVFREFRDRRAWPGDSPLPTSHRAGAFRLGPFGIGSGTMSSDQDKAS